MYIPKHFEEPCIDVMHELIRERPLATVVTLSSKGLNANHIPLYLTTKSAPLGTLRGHVARANPMWQDLQAGTEVLLIFHGEDAYITPSWYASKQDGGKVVPTWNYAVVHAHGILRVIDDTTWVRTLLENLTHHNEQCFPEPWAVADAPHEFTEKLLGAVIGIEIGITKMEGKWKVSQNQPRQNQVSVIEGLERHGHPSAMADLIKIRMKTE